jgi:hypothetical protein
MAIKIFFIKGFSLIFLVSFISNSILAQKVKIDTLTIDQLNLYRQDAVSLRNSGRFLTFFGGAVIATGIIARTIIMNNTDPNKDGVEAEMKGPIVAGICVIIGGSFTIAGIPMWAVGGNRKAKAELALQKFSMAPENSMAVGLGIKIRF